MKTHSGRYVIRRSLEHYIGPLTLDELRRSFLKMEFGLSDEVAGSLSSWVSLEDLDRLKRYYPDIASLVTEEFLGEWGVSENTQKNILNPKARMKPLKGIVIGVILTILVGGGAAMHPKLRPFLSKLLPMSHANSLTQLEEAATTRPKYVEDVVRKNLPKILVSVKKSRESFKKWAPLLRFYTFSRGGEGVSLHMLKGVRRYAAPINCTDEGMSQLLVGDDNWSQPKSVRLKFLFWDPFWIKRRIDWGRSVGPRNYYEACLVVAKRVLHSEEFSDASYQPFRERVAWQLGIIGGIRPVQPRSNDLLMMQSCLEESRDPCETPKGLSPDWLSYFDFYKKRIELSSHLIGSGIIPDSDLSRLEILAKEIKNSDSLTGLNYLPELQLAQSIISNNGSVGRARMRIQYDYPDIDFTQ